MIENHRVRNRTGIALTLVVAFGLSTARSSSAPSEKQACVDASQKAQQLRSDGKMITAREQLLVCARDACPGVVRKDCGRWMAEVDEALPSVVIGAKDGHGHDLDAVKVTVDGKVFADRLDGKAQPIDPGTHVFRFEHETAPPIEEKVVVREGEKNRTISVVMHLPGDDVPLAASGGGGDKAPRGSESREVPVESWVLGGVGVLALGSFVYFGLSGRGATSDLRSSCAPACNKGDVDSARTKLLIADVSLGVSVVALGLATFFFVSSTPEKRSAHLGVQPLVGGATLQLGGSF